MGLLAAAVLSMLQAVQGIPGHLARGLIGQLRSDRIEEREAAARSLVALGTVILPQLEEAASSRDVEVAGRARVVVTAIEDPLARATFRNLENTLNQAKTLTLRFGSEYWRTDVAEGVRKGSGVLVLKGDQKIRMSYQPPPSKWAETLTFVSDGATLELSGQNPISRTPSPLFKNSLGTIFVRRGFREAERVLLLYTVGEINEEAFTTSSSLKNLRKGPDDGDAKTLTYDVEAFGCDESRVTLWYDPKTSLILKRSTDNTRFGAWSSRLIETYDVQLDAAVPEERFALSRR